jgi:epoxyqueuosine reductase
MDKTSSNALASEIKQEAFRLGFNLVGITTPDPPANIAIFEAWLSQGHHADMGYMSSERARRKRSDPRLILPECRAIIALAMNYLPSSTMPDREAREFQIAAYALGDDYHDLLPQRMKRLVEFIADCIGREVHHKIYTDTGPLLERELAQRAGLGWIGKNSCLIHPQTGSYFVLGEILLDVPLPPDLPFMHDRCGTCTRCIDACPTECILPNRTVDSRKCISYWTIEAKNAIPPELRPLHADWIFGCDICQQVCPYNNTFAKSSEAPAFQLRSSLEAATLDDMLTLDSQNWRRDFKGSPLLRAKRRGLLRNAAVVAGNTGERKYVTRLTSLLEQDPEPLVRAHATWALGRIGSTEALDRLRAARSNERSPEVIEEIEAALQHR